VEKKRLLVTGGLGNLGSWIVQQAIKDFDVTVLSRKTRDVMIDGDYHLILADLSDLDSLDRVLGGQDFEYVIHTGSVNDGFVEGYEGLSYDINSFGTRNLLKALNLRSVEHFIYLSTFQVYGAYSGVIDESTLPSPKNDYGLSHLMAEYFLSMGMPQNSFSTIRLSNSYGCPKDLDSSKWYLVLNDLSKQAFFKQEIKLAGNGKAIRDFIWMGDVVKALLHLLTLDPENTIYNLSQGHATTMFEVAKKVQEAYQAYYGKLLPIETNTEDKSFPDQSLQVLSGKLRNIVDINSHDKMTEEAVKIFKLLEKIK
jgi:UDP-glucose 4-epimerase